jgi:hypothetical protein
MMSEAMPPLMYSGGTDMKKICFATKSPMADSPNAAAAALTVAILKQTIITGVMAGFIFDRAHSKHERVRGQKTYCASDPKK